MPDILYMRGAGLSKPFLHANCLQYAGRPPLLTFFHYVLAVFLLLASNYNFCRPRTGGGGGGGVGKEKKAVGKNEKNLHFFFFSFVQIPIHPEILHYYTIRLQRYVTTALEINNVDENKYVAIRKYEKEKMRKERKCRMRNNQKEKQEQELSNTQE